MLYIYNILLIKKRLKLIIYNYSKAAARSKTRQQPQKWLIIFGFVVNHPWSFPSIHSNSNTNKIKRI